jgi:AhpD family alkylhydroperoxidase
MHTPPSRGTFRRRQYHHAAQLWADLRRLATLRSAETVSSARRERLMLVVTAVNRCRYCATFHTHAAQLSGLSAADVAALLAGSTQGAPQTEIPALVYARHWAEAAGQPALALRAQLEAIYGPAQALAIERVLTMIWIGNLCGNTWDAILFRYSGGRLGQRREP